MGLLKVRAYTDMMSESSDGTARLIHELVEKMRELKDQMQLTDEENQAAEMMSGWLMIQAKQWRQQAASDGAKISDRVEYAGLALATIQRAYMERVRSDR